MTYPESAIPTARAKSHAVRADAEAADTVLVAGQHTDSLALEGVPYVACPVVIPTKEDATGDAERDGGDTTQYVVVRECVQLTVSAYVEQAARRIVRASSKSISVREEAIVRSAWFPYATQLLTLT